LRPAAADRERIEASLRARLGTDALPHDSGVARTHGNASWRVVAGVTTGLCVLGAAAFMVSRPGATTPAPQAVETATPRAASVLQPMAASTAVAVAPAPAVVLPAQPSATSAPHRGDRLAREVALLSRATSELRAGHAATSLKTLREHQRTFPNGTLTEERRAAKAQALCWLGRAREGLAEVAQLTPGSPTATRAEQACAPASSVAGNRK
jgi:hypothetical protein